MQLVIINKQTNKCTGIDRHYSPYKQKYASEECFLFSAVFQIIKKSFKILKGQLEAVYRRTDNTMAKDTKGVVRSRISKKDRQYNGQRH